MPIDIGLAGVFPVTSKFSSPYVRFVFSLLHYFFLMVGKCFGIHYRVLQSVCLNDRNGTAAQGKIIDVSPGGSFITNDLCIGYERPS